VLDNGIDVQEDFWEMCS